MQNVPPTRRQNIETHTRKKYLRNQEFSCKIGQSANNAILPHADYEEARAITGGNTWNYELNIARRETICREPSV